jgi:hypothetical protein
VRLRTRTHEQRLSESFVEGDMRPEIEQAARDAGCIPRRHPEYWDDVQVFATPDALVKFYDSAFNAGARAMAAEFEKAINRKGGQ